MAKRLVLPKDLSDNIPKLSIYEGIGLVDINVEPHLDLNNKEHMKEIYEATKYSTIYGIYDNSFIEIIDNTMEIYGEYQEYKKIDK